MTLGSECAVPPKPSKIKHKRMQSIPKCLPFTSHSSSSGLKPLTENKLMTTAVIWLLFLTPALLLHLSPMSLCSSLDLFFGYFKSIRSLRDECEEACVKKDLVWQGFRSQAVVCPLWHSMSDIGATFLRGSLGCCMLRIPEKKKIKKNHQETSPNKSSNSITAIKPMHVLPGGWEN